MSNSLLTRKKPVPPKVSQQQPAQKPVPPPVRSSIKTATTKSHPRPAQPVDKATLSTATKQASASARSTPALPGSTAQSVKEGNWINRKVQNSIAGVGSYAGGMVNSVGDGVNKIGESLGQSISNTTRGWGQGVAGYGNAIKDGVGVGGARVATAGNPLAIAGVGAHGKNIDKVAKASGKEKGKGTASNPLGI